MARISAGSVALWFYRRRTGWLASLSKRLVFVILSHWALRRSARSRRSIKAKEAFGIVRFGANSSPKIAWVRAGVLLGFLPINYLESIHMAPWGQTELRI